MQLSRVDSCTDLNSFAATARFDFFIKASFTRRECKTRTPLTCRLRGVIWSRVWCARSRSELGRGILVLESCAYGEGPLPCVWLRTLNSLSSSNVDVKQSLHFWFTVWYTLIQQNYVIRSPSSFKNSKTYVPQLQTEVLEVLDSFLTTKPPP